LNRARHRANFDVTCNKETLKPFGGARKHKFKFFQKGRYEKAQSSCPMPENSGSVFDSKMSASIQLRNDSEADTANASVMKKPRLIYSGGAISCGVVAFVQFGREVI